MKAVAPKIHEDTGLDLILVIRADRKLRWRRGRAKRAVKLKCRLSIAKTAGVLRHAGGLCILIDIDATVNSKGVVGSRTSGFSIVWFAVHWMACFGMPGLHAYEIFALNSFG